MSDDEGLVDEFVRLRAEKELLDKKLALVREEIVGLAQEKGVSVLVGADKKCFLSEYERIVYPEDKMELLSMIRKKGLYDKFSSLNYFKLTTVIKKGEIDSEVLGLVGREKGFRLSLRDK